MRHNPAAGAIVIMAHAASKCMALLRPVGELTEQGSPAFEAALPILSQLLKAEMTGREVRSPVHQLKAARFPNYHRRTRHRPRTGEASGQGRADRSPARALRPRHPRRTRLLAVQRLRRSLALPPVEQALRAHQRHHHDQSQLWRMADRLRRREDDNAARPTHSSLPHLETGNDSFRFKSSSAKVAKPANEKPRNLTNA